MTSMTPGGAFELGLAGKSAVVTRAGAGVVAVGPAQGGPAARISGRGRQYRWVRAGRGWSLYVTGNRCTEPGRTAYPN
jgi:hypothetical protein